jgi:hypothetical protein
MKSKPTRGQTPSLRALAEEVSGSQVRTTVFLPEEMHKSLRLMSIEVGKSMAVLIQEAVREKYMSGKK